MPAFRSFLLVLSKHGSARLQALAALGTARNLSEPAEARLRSSPNAHTVVHISNHTLFGTF